MSLNQSNGLGIVKEYHEVNYTKDDFTLKVNQPMKDNLYSANAKNPGCGKPFGESFCGYLYAYKKPMQRLLCPDCKKKLGNKNSGPKERKRADPSLVYPVLVTNKDTGEVTEYHSIKACARAYNVGPLWVRQWIDRGVIHKTRDKIELAPEARPRSGGSQYMVQVGDLIFDRVRDVCEHFYTSDSTVYKWIKAGHTPDGLPVKTIEKQT